MSNYTTISVPKALSDRIEVARIAHAVKTGKTINRMAVVEAAIELYIATTNTAPENHA